MTAMSQRDSGVGRNREGRRDSRHHLKSNAPLMKGFRFFTATSKKKRISSLKTHDAIPGRGPLNQDLVDLALRSAVSVANFADRDPLCAWMRQPQNLRTDQMVVEHAITR